MEYKEFLKVGDDIVEFYLDKLLDVLTPLIKEQIRKEGVGMDYELWASIYDETISKIKTASASKINLLTVLMLTHTLSGRTEQVATTETLVLDAISRYLDPSLPARMFGEEEKV